MSDLVSLQEMLNNRLDKRVDGMVEMGLLPEIRQFYNEFTKMYECQDYTKGVLQTIGFKEFIPYLEKYSKEEDDHILEYLKQETSDKPPPESLLLLNSCLDELKLVTRRYSKKQIKWVKNRLLGNLKRQVPPIYGLDISDPQKWLEIVYTPAQKVLEGYINETTVDIQALSKIETLREGMNEETSHYCETCERVFIGDYQFQLHMQGNKHKKRLASKRKKERQELGKNCETKVEQNKELKDE